MYILLRILILNVIKRVFEMYNKLYLKIDIKLFYYFNVKKFLLKFIILLIQKRVYVLFQIWFCKLVYFVFNYVIFVSYIWIFVEGVYLYLLIFKIMIEFKKFY